MSSFVLRRAMSTIKMPSLDFKPLVYQGPTYEDVLNVRKRNLTPSLVTFYKQPVLIHQGYMQWLFDQNNKRYLDLFGGIVTVSVGHCHPRVNEAAKRQMDKLWHTTSIYLYPSVHEYVSKLAEKMPGDLKVVYFVNSGSEANDLAMLMARLYTGANDIISLRNAYHGMSPWTMQLTAHSTWKYNVATGGVHQAKNPDPYRGEWGGKRCRDSPVQTTRSCECAEGQCLASEKYVEELEEVLRYSVPKGKVAGFFAESIQGVGGTVQFPKGYLKKAFELIRNYGGICISDEVQTGFGRTGEHYWGFQMHGVTPDIVTMAKGIGNGYPMAAVITTPKIAAVLSQAIHFNTFGGNPVASAIGSAVLDAIDEDNCQANSHNVGTYFLKKLEGLRNEFPNLIGDVRGKGLMIGMELVSDRNSRTPLGAQEFVNIWETCKDMGVLLGKGGFFGNVFRIKPPMCITKEDVDFATDVIRTAIKQNKDRNTP
ncbi:alanine--glyoxylate aminotransferase 2, mitochondrial-like [Artemia franciscana]|uniref:Alanine--glyoxylate aminotransferase 2, mitochondrial n=1 Tax=Artemia franciscana TaxID=6661 RepID=A0AA88I631_ARTSF|nr:hypothetical protein QYM36_002877 [Artemia franciscana]